MKKRVVPALASLAGLVASPLSANFHFMNIAQVFGGTPAAPERAVRDAPDVDGRAKRRRRPRRSTISDVDGALVGTFTFPPSPGGDARERREPGHGPDRDGRGTVPLRRHRGSDDDAGLAGRRREDLLGGHDRLRVDRQLHRARHGCGQPLLVAELVGLAFTAGLDIAGNAAPLDALDDTNDSARDFVLALPAPRNNAGARAARSPPSTCGNNTLEGLEDCDDGDTDVGRRLLEPVPARVGPRRPGGPRGRPRRGQPPPTATASWRPGRRRRCRPPGGTTPRLRSTTRERAALFTGPAGTTYSILDGLSDYGEIASGARRPDARRLLPAPGLRRRLAARGATLDALGRLDRRGRHGRRPDAAVDPHRRQLHRRSAAATSSTGASRRFSTTASRSAARPRSTAPTTRSGATRWDSSSPARSRRGAPTSRRAARWARAHTTAPSAASLSSPTWRPPIRPAAPSTTSPQRTSRAAAAAAPSAVLQRDAGRDGRSSSPGDWSPRPAAPPSR